jgi:ABC-2 type transport system permease protein
MLKMMIQLVLMEFKDYLRNPAILFWSIGFPLILATILGFAFTKKEEQTKKIGVIISTSSEKFISELKNLPEDKESFTKFQFFPMTLEDSITSMKKGKISLYIEKKNSQIQYYFDPNNSEGHLSYLLLDRRINSPVNKNSRVVTLKNQGERYIDFLIPGLLAFGIMNSCMWGTGWSLMDMRMKKLLRRMISTPLPKWLFLLSHFFSRGVLSGLEFILLIIFGNFFFDVKIGGSVLGLFLLFLSGNFAFSGIAIFASSRASNTSVANGVINAFTFPMMLLSGVFFSYHNFPEVAIKIIQYLPLTLLADSLRIIFIENASLLQIVTPVLIMNCIGVFFFYVGLKIYKWD